MNILFKQKKSQFLISIFSVILLSGIGYFFSNILGYKVIAFLLFFLVSILSMFFDIFPVLLASFLSAIIWDFFFIPPKFTFWVSNLDDRLLLLMYFIIASINAVLTYKIRKAEKLALLKKEKVKALNLYNTIFNSLSHELRTPISTIIGATDVLNDKSVKISEHNKQQLLNEILLATFRLDEQINNLLDMSRLEAGYLKIKKDWCDINELINSVLSKISDKVGKRILEIYIPNDLPFCKLDFVLIQQVLINLINNALLYTPGNAKITITVKTEKSHKLIIIIEDTGKGFPENEIDLVFNKFYRLENTQTGGTGLGLSIVKGYVEAHSGKITLENVPNSGAKFTIVLPVEFSQLTN